jgi:hypothetical protein
MPSMFKSPPKPKLPPPTPVAPIVPVAQETKGNRVRMSRAKAGGRTSTLLSDEKLGGG